MSAVKTEHERELARARNRRYYRENRDLLLAKGKAWREANPGYGNARKKVYDPDRVKRNAQQQAHRAFPDPEPCENCGTDIRVQRHHDDYSRPLDIRWLCASCHQREHGAERFV